MTIVLVAVAAYAAGCFCAGYYLVRWRTGEDVRRSGSGTAGATNAGRRLGRSGFVLTLVLDGLKGIAVAGAAAHWFDETATAAAVVAVVVGHVWPAQLRFRGGKGIATSLGACAIYDPRLSGAIAVLFLIWFCVSRAFVTSGLLAYALAPLAVIPLGVAPDRVVALTLVSAVVLVAHRENIRGGALCIARRPSASS